MREPRVALEIGGTDIGVNEGRGMPKAVAGHGQGVAKIAKNEVVVVRDAVGMGGDLPVEDEYLAPGQDLAEVIIAPAVAQAELQDRARHIADQFGRQVETCRPPAARESSLFVGRLSKDMAIRQGLL